MAAGGDLVIAVYAAASTAPSPPPRDLPPVYEPAHPERVVEGDQFVERAAGRGGRQVRAVAPPQGGQHGLAILAIPDPRHRAPPPRCATLPALRLIAKYLDVRGDH